VFGFQLLGESLDVARQFDHPAAHRDSNVSRVHARRPSKVFQHALPDRLVVGHTLSPLNERKFA
jgi:hypothetical protein